MFRVKLVLLSALALLAMGLVVSSYASADWVVCKNVGKEKGKYKNHECKEQGGNKEWEKVPIKKSESEETRDEGGPATFESTKFAIKCVKDTSEGTLKGEAELTDTIRLKNAKLRKFLAAPCRPKSRPAARFTAS